MQKLCMFWNRVRWQIGVDNLTLSSSSECFELLTGFRLVNTKCMMLVDMWKKIQHSNTVTLREVFTTKAFGDHCECAAVVDCVCIYKYIIFLHFPSH